jgi:1-aminocyclopropane-1-carboxylate deaminase
MSRNFGKSPQMLSPQPLVSQPLFNSLLEEKALELTILRLDQIHPEVSGNKFYKLKYNLEEAHRLEKRTILTFGGAFSNHIYATAAAALSEGFESVGVIRGEDDPKNPTLLHARKMGMKLHFVDRGTYREKNSGDLIESLRERFGNFYLIPEGGTNAAAIAGTGEILDSTHFEYSHICVSIGTGGTFAGLASSLQPHQTLLGFSSLKGDFIIQEIEDLLESHRIKVRGKVDIRTDYHFGGYGKFKPELIDFIHWFYDKFQIPLDPVYTGKMAFGVWDLLSKDYFPKGANILMIHTGGLQGNFGFAYQTGINLPRF